MIQPPYFHERLGPLRAGIIAGPFPERPLNLRLIEDDVSLNHDFRVRRDGKARILSLNQLQRLPSNPADELVLWNGVRHLDTPRQKD